MNEDLNSVDNVSTDNIQDYYEFDLMKQDIAEMKEIQFDFYQDALDFNSKVEFLLLFQLCFLALLVILLLFNLISIFFANLKSS